MKLKGYGLGFGVEYIATPKETTTRSPPSHKSSQVFLTRIEEPPDAERSQDSAPTPLCPGFCLTLRVQVPNYHILSKIVKPEYLIIGSFGPLGSGYGKLRFMRHVGEAKELKNFGFRGPSRSDVM